MTKKRISDARLKLLADISDLDNDLGKLEEKRDAISEKIRATECKLWWLKKFQLRDDLADNYGKPVICNKADECESSYRCPHGRIHTCNDTCARYCSQAEEQGFNDEICIPVTKPKKVKRGKI